MTLEDSGIAKVILERLGLKDKRPNMKPWRELVAKATKQHKTEVKVGIIAKYMDNADTYMCVFEALKAAGWMNDAKVVIQWIDAVDLETMNDHQLADVMRSIDGVVVPGGWGKRGAEGKIRAACYALEHKIPYLGLCYGLQMGVKIGRAHV